MQSISGLSALSAITSAIAPEAAAFISAAGITSTTQIQAVDRLVKDLKIQGIWGKLLAAYPFIGGSASSHRINLIDPRDLDAAFRLSFVGSWTHSANGVQGDGATAYANTFLIPGTHLSVNSAHHGLYLRQPGLASRVAYGSAGATQFSLYPNFGGSYYARINDASNGLFSATSIPNWWLNVRGSASGIDVYSRASRTSFSQNSGTSSTFPVFLSAMNSSGTPGNFSSDVYSFFTIGQALTEPESIAYYNLVQAFQTSLGRQI